MLRVWAVIVNAGQWTRRTARDYLLAASSELEPVASGSRPDRHDSDAAAAVAAADSGVADSAALAAAAAPPERRRQPRDASFYEGR